MALIDTVFKRLFLNQLNKTSETCSKDAITLSILFFTIKGVLSSASLAISISFNTKKRSAMKILKTSGPTIDPCGTPNNISDQKL